MAFIKAFALFAMATLSAAVSAHAETWRISALDWPPYSSPQEKDGGNAVAALRASLAKIGVTLEIDYMSFPRAKALAKSGRYIGYFPAWPEEIIEGFKGSRPIMMSQVGVVHRQDSSVSWRNTHDLFENYPVGYVRSFVYPVEIQEEVEHHATTATGVDTEQDLVRMLAAGRIEVAVTDPSVMLRVSEKMGITGLVANKYILFRKPLVLAFSGERDNVSRRVRLNNVLPQFSRNQLTCCAYHPPAKQN
ncbi:substrate-binding periplasmic protein [Roseibium alexandrii]|jgi:polar amino acid transport system substrate-binding protein